MTDSKIIDEFTKTWDYVSGMRDSFIACVPENRLQFTHHSKFAPLVKQFKHVVKVYGCYVDALETQTLDMSKKKLMFEGPETKENILALLHKQDAKLKVILADLKAKDLTNFKVSMFGMNMGFSEFTHVMIHHDVCHFGMWSNYAAFGEFDTPKSWQEDWKI